jgi:hypothetical protein
MANNDLTVDEFVKTRVLLEFRPIVEVLRKLLHKHAPEAREFMSYGVPNYKVARGIAVISPAKTHITLAFSRGADFEDKYGLLEGVGKVSKNVRFRKLKDINEEALRYYIRQALEFDKK